MMASEAASPEPTSRGRRRRVPMLRLTPARLAAQGKRDPSLLNYHAERRERAARCIQGYLQRQQRKEEEAASRILKDLP